jgi:aryl-alcohol dehydrogenase-like predicted oxidoreductase
MNFGPVTPEAESRSIMDAALDAGINFFDTANGYGKDPSRGWGMGDESTEAIIGRWLAQGGGRRERVVLCTKVYGKMGDWPNESGLSALHIRRACDESLRRLKTDHIDLYQMHHIDRETPWEEIWQAMDGLVQAGKVIYVGGSNFAAWNIAQANERAKHRKSMGLLSEQSLYNLLTRSIELEVIPACEAYGVGLMIWSPLSAGLLGGVVRGESSGRRASDGIQERLRRHRPQIEAYESLCDEIGERPADVALAWLLSNPAVTAPIVGPRTVEQLTASLRAVEIELSEDTLHRLDEIFPGPGGQAPEAYAW